MSIKNTLIRLLGMSTKSNKSKAEVRAWAALAKAARRVKQFMKQRSRRRNGGRNAR